MAAECLRDRHGFPIAHDCEQLARIYEPLHEKEEEDRAHAWHDFLSCAAAQLGAAPEPSARGGDAALAAAVLPLLMSDAGAPLLPQLSRLVHAGIPCGVRAAIWPLLLRAKRVSPDGHYEALLRVVDAGAPAAMDRGCFGRSGPPRAPRAQGALPGSCPVMGEHACATVHGWLLAASCVTLSQDRNAHVAIFQTASHPHPRTPKRAAPAAAQTAWRWTRRRPSRWRAA